jgi:hypothetical protein
MAALRHLARWLAWHIGEHDAAPAPAYGPPARITVFSTAIDPD